MPNDLLSINSPPNPRASWGLAAIVAILALVVLGSWFTYTQFRIDVPSKHMAIMIRKTGTDIANGDEIAPSMNHKGVQAEVRVEGRYFENPWIWNWHVIPQIEIPVDSLGVMVSLTGDDLPYGEFLAKIDETGKPFTKGIVAQVLKPGRYPGQTHTKSFVGQVLA
ncbi:MAG: hypothetical protein ABGX16_00440 [Pirellulales bacterium]